MLRNQVQWTTMPPTADKSLLLHGSVFALADAVTVYYWKYRIDARGAIFQHLEKFPPICTPVWQSCNLIRELIPTETLRLVLNGGLVAMSILSVASSVMFLYSLFVSPKKSHWAFRAMALSITLKTMFLLSDYRLDHNAHRMVMWSQLFFLLPIPNKADALRTLLVSYYLWAGSLKFNSEWLSGAPLMGKQLWPAFLFTPAITKMPLYYTGPLEVISAWGLMANPRSIWLALAFFQFFMFHLASFTVVGYYYPLSMFALLSIIPAIALFPDNMSSSKCDDKASQVSLLRKFVTGKAPKSSYAAFLLFGASNLYPHLAMPGDRALTGEGRTFALHMLDAATYCNRESMAELVDMETNQSTTLGIQYFNRGWVSRFRMVCDPFVLMQMLSHSCKLLPDSKYTFDIHLLSKRTTDDEFSTIVREEDICNRFSLGNYSSNQDAQGTLRYSWWKHNEWILPDVDDEDFYDDSYDDSYDEEVDEIEDQDELVDENIEEYVEENKQDEQVDGLCTAGIEKY